MLLGFELRWMVDVRDPDLGSCWPAQMKARRGETLAINRRPALKQVASQFQPVAIVLVGMREPSTGGAPFSTEVAV